MVQQQISDFFSSYPERFFKKGEIIIFAHMELSSVFHIKKGSVIQYDITPSGNRSILNTFKPGAFFPMSNAVNNIDTPYFFEADEDVIVRVCPAPDAVDFIKTHPDVLFDLLSRTYRGTDGLLLRLSELMHGDASSRILRELQILAKRFGTDEKDGFVVLKKRISETQLAERTGLARETVSRAITRLKQEGSLTVSNGHFSITDN